MKLTYRIAGAADAALLVGIYNAAFYDDFVRYGECPAYGRTTERMEQSIAAYPKYIIYCDGTPVGVISYSGNGDGSYYIGCLCVIPGYQNRGIGTKAMSYLLDTLPDWKHISLITPEDSERNIHFYTVRCGFRTGDRKNDGNVRVVTLFRER